MYFAGLTLNGEDNNKDDLELLKDYSINRGSHYSSKLKCKGKVLTDCGV